MKKIKIYLASSFAYKNPKTKKERIKNIEAAQAILEEKLLCEVYVPHHHKIHRAWEYTEVEWAEKVAKKDFDAIYDCDLVVLLTYGKEKNNAGVSCECGYAYGIQKPVLLVKMNDEEESMMMWVASHGTYVEGLEGLSQLTIENIETMADYYNREVEVDELDEPDPHGEKRVIPFKLS